MLSSFLSELSRRVNAVPFAIIRTIMNSNLTAVVQLFVEQTSVDSRKTSWPFFGAKPIWHRACQLERGHFGAYLLLCSNVRRYSNIQIYFSLVRLTIHYWLYQRLEKERERDRQKKEGSFERKDRKTKSCKNLWKLSKKITLMNTVQFSMQVCVYLFQSFRPWNWLWSLHWFLLTSHIFTLHLS